MKIQQVEELVSISKKNIRFYEEQGLLSPGRAENGYREYGREDARRLQQIKLLRKLAVPIEDIRAVLKGEGSLETCLSRQLQAFDRQRESLDAMEDMTKELLSRSGLTLEGLDAESCLEQIERLEKEGQSFMDVSKRDVHRRKATGAILGAVIFIALILPALFVILWANGQSPLPVGLLVLFVAIPVVVIVCVVAVLIQRIKEIKGGEEDEAAQY
ncbi:MAG: MerR family transcriptional regulator [Clostridia bacterium]|nr:MerR family transcriptional regulator [Clostridia bacterium]